MLIFSSSTSSTLRIIGVTIFFDSGGVGVDADKEEEEADKVWLAAVYGSD